MRIALTITELWPGGAEKCFVNLARFLQSQGHEVRVWELWPPPPESARGMTNRLNEANIPWKSGNAVRAWHFPGVCHWLRRELDSFAPDVVQSFLFHANVATAIALQGRKTPFLGGARVRQPEYFRQKLHGWASRRMQKLVCVSESVAAHCAEIEGIRRDQLVVIPNGFDISEIHQSDRNWTEFGLPAKAQVALFVGRLDSQKGVVPLVESAEQFLKKTEHLHLVLMGQGPMQADLESRIAGSPYSSRMHLIGWQPEPIAWMQKAQMLLLPAVYEGMPNVVLEAMAVGIPVVSFDVDGVRELLGTGIESDLQIVPSQDYAAFAKAILRLVDSAALREQCGEFNQLRINNHFQLEKQLLCYEELYRNAVK